MSSVKIKLKSLCESMVGTHFRQGEEAQCMNFVRAMLYGAGAIELSKFVTESPKDGYWTLPALASSLCGEDVGTFIMKPSECQLGDIAFFNDTYDVGPDFGPNTITHVGLMMGPNSMIHRPTVSRPVERVAPTAYGSLWRCAVRPYVKFYDVKPSKALTDPEPGRLPMAKVYLGPQEGSKLIGQAPITEDGRIVPTLGMLAALTEHKLVWNAKAKAARFEK